MSTNPTPQPPNTSYKLSGAARSGQPWSKSLFGTNFDRRVESLIEKRYWDNPWLVAAVVLLSVMPAIAIITTPLELGWQALFGLGTFLLALWINRLQGRLASHVLIVLSLLMTSRYMYWRITQSMNLDASNRTPADIFFAVGLVAAELYAFLVLFLGYFQVLWPLNRKPFPLPADPSTWPTVDIYIPTYNEPLRVVRPTVLAALDVDWPKDKLKVYVLDDGRREEFRAFCAEVGVTHITRNNSRHAKAGNLNQAMPKTEGEFITIFDCDHVPTRSFLQLTMGWFLKDFKLAMVQTPHHFFSPDPFERNLHTFRKVPNEGELFYGLLQDGNDFWNATFFCGSCAVLRRTAILEVGGIATETVTEDAHTALKMHSRGWTTAYINVAQAAGLATESLSAHVGQRIRWARGMAQIFRIDNPFFKKGLAIGQRLCYANAMLHFFYGLPRIVFLTAPLSYLFFEAHIIEAPALLIASYALPHLAHAAVTNSRLQGFYRHSFWAEVYETVLSTYILGPTLLALINPRLGTFNVTAKGGLVANEYFDRDIAKPYVVLLMLNIAGFLIGIGRFFVWNTHEVDTVVMNMAWTAYNLVIIGAALSVAWESRQIREHIRVSTRVPVKVRVPDMPILEGQTADISEGGLSVLLNDATSIARDAEIEVALLPEHRLVWMPCRVIRSTGRSLALRFESLTIPQERQLVYALFGRADAWVNWAIRRRRDSISDSFRQVMELGFFGTARILRIFFTKASDRSMNAARTSATVSLQKPLGTIAMLGVLLLGLFLLLAPSARAQGQDPTADAPTPGISGGSPATFAAAPAAPVTPPPASDLRLPAAGGALPPGSPLPGGSAMPMSGVSGTPNSSAMVPGAPTSQQGVGRGESRLLSFQSLGIQRPIRLRGVQGEIALPLAVRDDEIITRARLTLRFSHSPSLIFPLSHLNILVNNELAATIPLTAETAGGAERTIDIDPRLFVEYNQIGLQLIAHYTMDCEDPVHTTLWAIVSNKSTIDFQTMPLAIKKDLNILPRPFFDERDTRQLSLPFVFSGTPSLDDLKAAGVVASYFGAKANYRGARFPVRIDSLPPGNAVVFSSNGRLPGGLAMPAGAKVALVDNPQSPDSLLLVVMGGDGKQLNDVARALALNTDAMAGTETAVTSFQEPDARKAYDAPRWIPTDKIVQFGELAQPWELESSGLYPDLIKVNFHAPPDLFTWRGRGMKLNVKYRYTPTVGSKSTLNVNINNEFVQAIALSYTGEDKAAEQRINLPFVSQYQSVNSADVYVPEYKFAADNVLQFQYYFERKKEGACKDIILDNLRGSIDQDSTIDLTAFPHYAYLPELSLFANGGFPFTKFADLSQTAVIMPDTIRAEDIEAYLTVMGRIGNSTGYPGTRFEIGQAASVSNFADKDLLVFGAAGNQRLLEDWADKMPMSLAGGQTKLRVLGSVERIRAKWDGRDLQGAVDHAGEVILRAGRSLGAIMSFESPLKSKRTVVLFTAGDSRRLTEIASMITEAGKSQFVRGDLVLVNGDQLNNYLIGDQYTLGHLPPVMAIRWWFSRQPVLLIFMCVLAALLVAVVLYRLLRQKAMARKQNHL